MEYREPACELLAMSVVDLIQIADVRPSQVRRWTEKGALPGVSTGHITIRDVVLASMMDALENVDVSIKLASLPARNLLYFVVNGCPDAIEVGDTLGRPSKEVTRRVASYLAYGTSDCLYFRVRQFAVVQEGVYLRLGTKRLARNCEDDYDFEIFDLKKLAGQIVDRVDRPLVRVTRTSTPAGAPVSHSASLGA